MPSPFGKNLQAGRNPTRSKLPRRSGSNTSGTGGGDTRGGRSPRGKRLSPNPPRSEPTFR